MILLGIVLALMLALQLTFAPYINPPYAPEGLRFSPPDLTEVVCTVMELVILFAGWVRFTNPSTTVSDVFTIMAALLSLFGPPGFAYYSRTAHKDWYEDPAADGNAKDEQDAAEEGEQGADATVDAAAGEESSDRVENPVLEKE